MAISVGGLISGIDTKSVIKQLTELERKPILKLQTKEAAYQVKLTSYGGLRSVLSSLRSAAAALDSPSDFNQFSGVSSNPATFTASVFSTATGGSTSISVHSLAQVHKVKSEAFGTEEAVGEGTFTLQLGDGEATEISTSAEDTITDVARKINEAQRSIHAAVITDGTRSYLTLTGQRTGEANTIRLEVTAETPPPAGEPPDPENPPDPGSLTDKEGLSRLLYLPGGENNGLVETQKASDAVLTVDGVENIRRPTNVVTDVLKGVVLTLTGTTEQDQTETLTISRDTAAVAAKVNAFVDAYNAVTEFFKNAQSYDPQTQRAGILLGDGTTNLIRNRLRTNLAGFVSGGVEGLSRLSDLGVTLNKDGKLQVDHSTLNDAIQSRFDDVTTFFTANEQDAEGFGVNMVKLLDRMLNNNNGDLAVRTKGIQTSVDRISKDIARHETRILKTESRLQTQFQNLERLLGQYQKTGDYLAQQITALQNMNQSMTRR